MNQIAKHIIFIGRVQGVGFRFTSYNIAHRHRLTGYVRNVLDGTVDMVVQGPSDDIDACIRDLNNAFAGYIRQTRIEEVALSPQHADFKITF